jgi:hypothetical protein
MILFLGNLFSFGAVTFFQAPESSRFDWGNVVSGTIGGLIAVVVTLLAEFLIRRYEKSKEKSEQQVVTFQNESRTVTGAIFTYLGPGASIEMMKHDLGPPNKQYGTDAGLFTIEMYEDDPVEEISSEYVPEFTAYLYFFKNAHVKFISKDKQSIDAITVFAFDQDASISLPHSQSQFLNQYSIDEQFFVDNPNIDAEHFPGCRDVTTAICSRTYFPGLEIATTYFCDNPKVDYFEADLKNNPKELLGATVYGVCISKGIENVSFIYSSECF